MTFEPQRSGTDIKQALEYMNSVVKKRAIVFLLSDFIDQGYERAMRIVGRRHDLTAVHVIDPREYTLPDVGLVRVHDAESGSPLWVDTSAKRVRRQLDTSFRCVAGGGEEWVPAIGRRLPAAVHRQGLHPATGALFQGTGAATVR